MDTPLFTPAGGPPPSRRRALVFPLVALVALVLAVTVVATRQSPEARLTAKDNPLDPLTTTTAVGEPSTTSTSSAPTTTTTVLVASGATLTAESGTLRLEVVVQPPELMTAQILRLQVKATDRAGSVIHGGADFGDSPTGGGGRPSAPILECREPGVPIEGPRAEKTWTIEHSFRVPGAYPLQVFAASSSCDTQDGTPNHGRRTVSAKGLVTVGKGLLLANGPMQPVLDLAQRTDFDNPTHALVNVAALDKDGWVRRVTLDWGDGSEQFVFEPARAECVDPLKSWPGPSEVIKAPTHRYASPGSSYTVRASVTSSACDGSELQTATATLVVKAPSP